VSLVSAVGTDVKVAASSLIAAAAKAVGGGGGGKGDIATAGGKNPAGLDEAMSLAREAVHAALSHTVA
jgi:alanyl-tRNA synthetase